MNEAPAPATWIAETKEAVHLATNASEAKKQAEALREAEAELRRLLDQLRDLQVSAAVVRGLGWPGKVAAPDVRQALDQATGFGARPLARVPRPLEQYCRDVESSIAAHWREHASRELGDVTGLLGLANTLAGVAGIAEVSQELQATLGQLERTRIPTSQSVALLAKAKSLLTQLESSLQPDEVRQFLSAVARGGASVQALTQGVASWLESHGSLDHFKIVAGSPAGGRQ